MSGRTGRVCVAAVMAVGATVGMGMTVGATPPTDEGTETVVQVVDLGEPSGTTGVDLFDPTLGELLSVTYRVQGQVRVQVCIENLSQEASSTTGGPGSGELAVTLADLTVPVALTVDVPATTLSASDGGDDCVGGFDDGSVSFPGTVSSSDVYFDSQTVTDDATATVTDPAALSSWIAGGETTTRDITWTSGSAADINQQSEWDIYFIAEGSLEVTVEYVWAPDSTIETVPPEGGATTTSTLPGQLPATGSSTAAPLIATAAALVAAGGVLAVVAIRRRQAASH